LFGEGVLSAVETGPGQVPDHFISGSAKGYFAAPHFFVAARSKTGLAQFRVFHKRIFASSSAEVAHRVLVERRDIWLRGSYFRKLCGILGDSLLSTEGKLWRNRHDTLQPLFRRNQMHEVAAITQRATAQMLDRWEELRRAERPISALHEAEGLALDVIAERLYGELMEHEAIEQMGAKMQAAVLLLRERNTDFAAPPNWAPTPRNRRIDRFRRELDAFFASRIDARSAGDNRNPEHLVDELIAARHPVSKEGLSRTALIDESKTLFFAGFETTAPALSWALYLLSEHPRVVAKWQEEIDAALAGRPPEWADLPKLKYTSQIAQEALRLYPPVYNLARECSEDDEIEGRRIPKGSLLIISVYGVHRSAVWGDDVETFRPERFDAAANWPRRAFLPFASGEHVCVGSNFAMTELVVALAMIGQRFGIRRADREPFELRAAITLYPSRDILLQLTARGSP
jgi:cytochrome P450